MQDKRKMGGLSENGLIEQISEVGNRLFQPPKSTHQLLNLLDEVEFLLTKVGQAPSYLLQVALLIPMKALIADELFRHSDPNVRISVASCLNEVMRITAPTPPYDDDKMREIFKLIVSSFENLSNQPGRCYSKAVLILQSVARLRSCVMMLDIDCDPLVINMFELFHRKISPKLPHDVHFAMANIMSVMVQESDSVSGELLKVLLSSIKMENQSVSPESWELGIKVFEECAVKLRPFIMETVSSMGCCLENYAPILSSICNPEPDTAMNVINDASFLVNKDPSDNLAHPAEYVHALAAIESFELVNVSGGADSKRRRKRNSHNLDEEATGQQFVQALEAAESFECVKASGSGRAASKRGRKQDSTNFDEEATGLQLVQALAAVEICETEPGDYVQAIGPPYVQALVASEICETALTDYVQALEAAESFEHVHDLGTGLTVSERVTEQDFKNLGEEATGLGCEQAQQHTADNDDNDISENNEILKKDSSAVGDGSKRKRGRPPKKSIRVLEDNSFQTKNDVSTAPVDYVQALEPTESFEHVNALEPEGTAYKRGTESSSKNLDEEAIDLERETHLVTVDDEISLSNGIIKKDSSVVSDGSKRKRGRPRKKGIVGVLEDNALQKKSDVSEARGSSRNNLLKQGEFSGGSGDKVIETPHGIKNYEGDLVGCRIKVWWPLDRRYYKGTITLFDAYGRKHMVNYDDGDEEMLNLRKERWEFIGDETSIDTALLVDA